MWIPKLYRPHQRQLKRPLKSPIDYWVHEFAKVSPQTGVAKTFKLGTQTFSLVGCQEADVDLKILVGHGTLDNEQIGWLKKPEKYIGVTVRTDYDPIELRGQGFIYIASDLGPNSYTNTGGLVDKAWESEKLLKYAFLHEFGHVFGIPHRGNGLMSQIFSRSPAQ